MPGNQAIQPLAIGFIIALQSIFAGGCRLTLPSEGKQMTSTSEIGVLPIAGRLRYSQGDILFHRTGVEVEVYRFRSAAKVTPVGFFVDESGREVSGPVPLGIAADNSPDNYASYMIRADLCKIHFESLEAAQTALASSNLDWIEDVIRTPALFDGTGNGGLLIERDKSHKGG